MKLSVIICCYNEAATIQQVVQKTKVVTLPAGWEREIMVIDNFSTDGTRDILRQLNDPDIRLIFHERNMGKGMSIRTGIAHMTGDYLIIQDADLEYDPAEHPRFCRKADETHAAAIFGSRVLDGDVKYEYTHAYLGVRFLTAVTNLLFGGHLTDVATATKMVRADVVQSLNLTTTDFNLDFELPDKILLAGYQIIEIPITYNPRTYEEGKKIKTKDGIRALFTMLRDRLGLTPVLKPDTAVNTKEAMQNT
ncbi:MAG: glycosyltransferase family 2 protein [Chloroflexi bacterium]|nr:glycosyltransferase family 2 protein [Ardenticatenaceae bacterium]MBL1128796.1 glycosyltransferase family 2 protein [Chloroflexota bacterium]NOG34874.1 glycosyltransferase family 2 protein [Chloroflexota bacterium]